MGTDDAMRHPLVERDVPLAHRTTFRVGGSADFFCAAGSVQDVREVARFARERGLPVRVLGGGSNVLVRDEGVRGLVVQNALRGMCFERGGGGSVTVRAEAGEPWDALVSAAVERGLWGLENLSGIPGLVGATPIQNVGAYGADVSSRISAVEALDIDRDEVRTFSPEECAFRYRDSFFKRAEGKRFIITAVTYRLDEDGAPDLSYRDVGEYFAKCGTTPTLALVREAVLEIRRGKFPDIGTIGTAGSFFKNPIISAAHYKRLRAAYPALPGHEAGEGLRKVPAGWLIEHVAQMRGARDGAVGSSPHHALALVNYGSARASEIMAFAERIRAKIAALADIELEYEVQVL